MIRQAGQQAGGAAAVAVVRGVGSDAVVLSSLSVCKGALHITDTVLIPVYLPEDTGATQPSPPPQRRGD